MVRALRWSLIGAGILLLAASAFETYGTVAFCNDSSCVMVATILIVLAVVTLIAGIIFHFVNKHRVKDTMTITIAEGDEKDAEQLGKISDSVSQHKNAERRFAHQAATEEKTDDFIELTKETVTAKGVAKPKHIPVKIARAPPRKKR